jgi:hypothetical protein
MKNGYLIGIIHFTGNDCDLDTPKVLTFVYPYWTWIMEKLKIANDGGAW